MATTATFKPNSTVTVDALKIQEGFSASEKALDIIQNPKTGKVFFQVGSVRGAVTSKLTPQQLAATYAENPRLVCVSVLSTADGDIPVLHKRGENNVMVTF